MPAGRPTDLTPEIIEDVRRLLPTVLYLETVADYVGVSRISFRAWIKRGTREAKRLRDPKAKPKTTEALYLQFLNAVKKAMAEGELYDAGVIKKAAVKSWQAAAWRLERRFPERWGQQRDALRELMAFLKEQRKATPREPDSETPPGDPGGAKSKRKRDQS